MGISGGVALHNLVQVILQIAVSLLWTLIGKQVIYKPARPSSHCTTTHKSRCQAQGAVQYGGNNNINQIFPVTGQCMRLLEHNDLHRIRNLPNQTGTGNQIEPAGMVQGQGPAPTWECTNLKDDRFTSRPYN